MNAPSPSAPARSALLAGATGLVGRELLMLLLASPRYGAVHTLLRRSATDLPVHPKLQPLLVDFEHLPALPAVDEVFIALGTTIKVAGSQAAFRRVDFDAVLTTARAARAAGAKHAFVVSALGASADSSVFYNRVKGEMEAAVAQLGFGTVVFARPSLLVGDRTALGQPVRAGERWAMWALRPVLGLVPAGVRPIEARHVAQALLRAADPAQPGVHILDSAQMQQRDHRR